jgi:hypothetical protein
MDRSFRGVSALRAASIIESIMYFGIGFLVAALVIGGLSVLVVVPVIHGRAVRLTTWRLEAAIALSMMMEISKK